MLKTLQKYLSMKNTFIIVSLTLLFSCKSNEITPVFPILGTITISETTIASARFASEIMNVGNQTILDYGFVYAETNTTPTLADSKTSHGAITMNNSTSDNFSDVVQGLKPNTNYYVRSYATTASGSVFGQTSTFKTSEIIQPGIKTDAVILVFINTAKLRGIVESKGTYDISEYGICWSSNNVIPTTADSKSSKMINLTIFPTMYTEDATNLTANTTYYFRAFVISNGVTFYGNTLTFSTLANR
jgi:hypothetical protein